MKNKLKFLIDFSLGRKIKKKSFIISNIILLVLILIVSNLDIIIDSFKSEEDKSYTVYYQADLAEDYFASFEYIVENSQLGGDLNITFINEHYEVTTDDGNVVFVEITNGDNVNAKVVSNELISTSLYSGIYSAVNAIKTDATAKQLGISQEDVAKITSDTSIERIVLSGDEGDNEIQNSIIGGLSVLLIFPFFFGIIMVIQMIGLEIFDEKSTRSMEVIMSSVKPKVHLLSKIVAVNMFAIIQFGLIALYGLIGVGVRSLTNTAGSTFSEMGLDLKTMGLLDNIGLVGVFIVVIFILTNLIYSLVMALLSSTANEMDDYQKIIAPLMITMLIGFYTAIFAPLLEAGTFARVMAHIPFFSLMIAPSLFISGTFTWVNMVIIILILIGSVIFFYWFGLPVYKQSVLDYSSDKVFKRLFRNIKRSQR